MMKQKQIRMMNLLASVLIIAFSTQSLASEVKVEKVKDNKAIISLPNGVSVQEGKLYELTIATPGTQTKIERDKILSMQGTLGQITQSVSGTKTSTSLIQGDILWGWNMKKYEYGPMFQLERSQTDVSSSTLINFGMFYDYNMVPNAIDAPVIPGVSVKLSLGVGQQNLDSTTSSISSNIFTLGIFNKWFLYGPNAALRGDIAYSVENRKAGSDSMTITGFGLTGGFIIYY